MSSYLNSFDDFNKKFSQDEIIESYFPVELKIKTLYEKINKLEKELQTMKDNLYQVFFNEDLTNEK